MVKSVTGESLELHWAPPASATTPGMIVHYNIKFNIGERNYYFDTRTPLPQFTITGLKPGSRVDHIRVCPVYYGGEDEGSYSPHVYAMTNDYPLEPRGLRSTSDSQSSVTLSWNHPEFDGRTPIRQYAVTYTFEGVPRSFATSDDVPRCTVHGLPAGSKLENVMVAAINDVGQGPPSAILPFAETRVVGATELHITQVTNTAVQLHWVPPENQEVFGYVLRYEEGGEAKEVHTNNNPQHLISGLAPGAKVSNVRVAPITNDGEGQESNTLREVQTMGTCGPPEQVHITNATDSSLSLEWTPPRMEANSDPITYYTVAFDVAGDVRTVSTPNAEPRVVLSGLPAASFIQNITVRGVVAGVPGEPAVPVSGKTLVYDAPPANLRVSSVHTDRVQLMWDPPEEPTRSYVTSYVVSYTIRGVMISVNTRSGGTSFELGGGGGDPPSLGLPSGAALTDVSVHAVTNKGATSESNVIAVRTISVPAAVTGLRKSAEQSNGMTLHWNAPVQGAGTGGVALQKYIVSYTVDGEEVISAVAPNATSFALRGLPPQSQVPFVDVVAVNRVGQSEPARVRGRERPDPPAHLRVLRSTGDTVTLSWQKPGDDGGTELMHYVVRYSVPTNGAGPVECQTAGVEPQFTIGADGGTTPLPLGSILENITVQAVNLAGASEPSNVVASASTLSRSAPPQRLILGDVGDARSLPLRWEAPVESGGAAITSYLINYKVNGEQKTVDTGENTSSYALAGPGAGVAVTAITVQAITQVGPSAASNVVALDALLAPRGVAVGKVTMTSIPLSWEPSQDTAAPVRSYIVKYNVGARTHSINTGSAEPKFVIGSGAGTPPSHPVPSNTDVVFNVAAVNVVGVGAASASQRATTAAEGAPSDVQVTDFTENSITVTWVEPTVTAHPATKYVVSYELEGQAMSVEVPAPANTAVISDLAPGTEITSICVQGVSDLGPGPKSAVLPSAQTLDKPGPPQAAKVLEVTPVSVTVAWKKPLQTGGRIDRYHVRYVDAAGEKHVLTSPDPNVHRIELDHLPHAYMLKHIKVSAVNGAGEGPGRDAGSATTHDVPAVPEDLFIGEVTTTTVNIEWDEPEHNGGMPITSFTVRYSVDGHPTATRVEPDIYVFQIAGILPGHTVSDICVAAENGVGMGPATAPQSVDTELPLPPAPEAPELRKAYRSKKKLDVRWRNPQFGMTDFHEGEDIVAFELQWIASAGFSTALSNLLGAGASSMVPDDSDESQRWALCHKVVAEFKPGHEHQHAVVEALPNCSYDFRVRAKNRLGAWGPFSPVSEPIFLRAAHGQRPERRPVRGITVGHTGGGYVASSSEIKRCVSRVPLPCVVCVVCVAVRACACACVHVRARVPLHLRRRSHRGVATSSCTGSSTRTSPPTRSMTRP